MHGFCTDFARFQNVQRVLFAAKSDKGCRNCRVKNHVALIKNNDDSKLPEIETNRRLALLISGPRVRVPGGAPDIERQIVRFGVLSLCRKAAAHFLHTVCTACFPLHKNGTCRGEAPPSCCARPFCRLKAPLRLSLLRFAAQTRTFESTPLSAGCKKKEGKLW